MAKANEYHEAVKKTEVRLGRELPIFARVRLGCNLVQAAMGGTVYG